MCAVAGETSCTGASVPARAIRLSNARSVYGATALDIAMREGRDEAVDALRDATHEAHDDVDRRRTSSRSPRPTRTREPCAGGHRSWRPGRRAARRPRTRSKPWGSFHALVERQAKTLSLPRHGRIPGLLRRHVCPVVSAPNCRRRSVPAVCDRHQDVGHGRDGAGYRATTKSSLPKRWRPRAKHTHVAVEDAIEQGELFMNILRELNAQRGEIVPPASRQTERRRRHDQRR